jgi:hypothetical protein
VVGVQQTFELVQTWPPGHVPQDRVPPQPSEIEPQFFPWAAQVVGVQVATHASPAALQLWPAGQLPQLSVPPQPSAMLPQIFPWAVQVVVVHALVMFPEAS